LIESKIAEVRIEWQSEMDKLTEQIKVLLERLARKDAEVRRLIVEISEYKEIKILWEQDKERHRKEIVKIT